VKLLFLKLITRQFQKFMADVLHTSDTGMMLEKCESS